MNLNSEDKLTYVRGHLPYRINAVNHLVEYGRWNVRGDEGVCVLPWYEDPRPSAFVVAPFCGDGLISGSMLLSFLGFSVHNSGLLIEAGTPDPGNSAVTIRDLCGATLGAEHLSDLFGENTEEISRACGRVIALAKLSACALEPLAPFKTWKREYLLCALAILRLLRDHVNPKLTAAGLVALRPTLFSHIPMLMRYTSAPVGLR
jgi:hypothetical protein